MKNSNKLFGIIAAVAIIGLFMMGCENTTTPKGKTPLGTPANVRVDDAGKTAFTLKWDAVEGADSYTLDIDGVLQQVSASTTSYDLKALTADPKVYPIRIRAVAYTGDAKRTDSAYSAPLNVEPAEYIFTYTDDPAPSASVQTGRGIARAAGENGTITGLTNYGKGLERIVIPPRIGSVTITIIGSDAFKDNGTITSISLPETLITIGAGALSGTNISSIVIPASVLNIGDGAFSNILVLVVVVFVSPEPPALGNGVFTGSDSIDTIVVPDGKGDTYTSMIQDKAPDLAATNITETKGEKLLIGIEVAQPPKTAYTEGEQFSGAGMTVIARYSDNTTSSITNYTVMLRSSEGFSAESRALTLTDSVVRLSYTEGDITRTTDIAIRVTGQPYAITVNEVSGGTITTNPSGSATAGSSVTVNVSPGEGYTFDTSSLRVTTAAAGEDGAATPINTQAVSGSNNSYTFTMPASAVTISGTFSTGGTPQPSEYKIYVTEADNGTITTDPSGNAPSGSTVTVTVSPGEGYTFNASSLSVTTAASDNGTTTINTQAVSGSNNRYTFTMPASDVTISGTFARSGSGGPTSYNITVNQTTGGTVTTNPSGNATAGTTVRVTGTPNDNYYLASIRVMAGNTPVDSQESPDGGGYTFTMPASEVTVTGTFAEKGGTQPTSYKITVNAGNGGTITTNPSGSATAGTKVTVNVSPNRGYYMSDMLSVKDANGKDVVAQAADTAGTIWTFTMPASNVAISGTFSTSGTQPTEYEIWITAGTTDTGAMTQGGTITTDPSEIAAAGTTVYIYVTPDQGYTLVSLTVVADNYPVDYQTSQAMTGPIYTFTMPESNVLISGMFTGGDGSFKLSGMSVADATSGACTATDFAYISWGNTPTSLSTLMTGSPKVTVSTSSSMGGKLLSIELYAAEPAWTLFDIEKFDYVAVGLTATPNDAHYQQIYSFYESAGGYLLQLLDGDENPQYLYYVDKDVTLSGTTDRGISADNVLLRQGWNFVYTEAKKGSPAGGWDLVATQTLPEGWYWSLTGD